ncbi:SDR family NAD(P)-dependent oxidoreductase [Variovorax sp. NFACC26]
MALGDVQMPSQGTDPAAFVLPPSLLDGALQASIGLVFAQPQDRLSSLPFAVEAVELYGVVPEKAVAVVRQSEGSMIGDAVLKLDVSLVDAEGRVCVQLRGFSSRVLDSVAGQAAAPAPAPAKGEVETLLLRPTWQEAQLPAAEPVSYGAHWVVLCEVGGDAEAALKAALPQARCLHLSAEGADLSTRYGGYAAQLLAYLQAMFSEKPSGWVRVQLVVPASGEGALLAGLGGMLKSARQESPKLVIQVLGVEPSLGARGPGAVCERRGAGVRGGRALSGSDARGDAPGGGARGCRAGAGVGADAVEARGVYLISGGAGGLGLIFGKAIATAVSDVTLVLTGRSVLGAEKLQQLRQLEALGARVVYRQVDVTDAEAVAACVREVVQAHGGLTGVIHTAGVLRDSFLVKKTESELRAVLAPKVAECWRWMRRREISRWRCSSASPRLRACWGTWARRTTRRPTRSWMRTRRCVRLRCRRASARVARCRWRGRCGQRAGCGWMRRRGIDCGAAQGWCRWGRRRGCRRWRVRCRWRGRLG